MHNPSGDIDIARIDDVQTWLPKVSEQLALCRGKEAVIEGIFAYYIGKRGHWVRRVAARTYRDCGIIAFKPPAEGTNNPLNTRVFGKPKKKCF